MAGMAKPNVEKLGKEAKFQIINSLVVGSVQGLFDGTQVNSWNSVEVCYWNNRENYLEIDIFSDCNIWRSGTGGWASSRGKLLIKQWTGNAYIDVTNKHTIETSEIDHTQWEKFVYKLPAGRYRFEFGGGYRIDSEWYIEHLAPPPKTLIKSQNKIHTLSKNREDLIYPNLQEPLTQVDYEKWGMDSLIGYENEIDKVRIEMNEIEELEGGKVLRKIINKNEFKIYSLGVK